MFEAVRAEIPIECHSYPCPKCGGLQDLDYKVQKIDAQGNEFSSKEENLRPDIEGAIQT